MVQDSEIIGKKIYPIIASALKKNDAKFKNNIRRIK